MTQINADRLLSTLETLRNFGRCGTGVHRPALTPADLEARLWLRGRLADLGYDAEDRPVRHRAGARARRCAGDPARLAHRYGAARRMAGRSARRRLCARNCDRARRRRWAPTRPGSTWSPFRTRKEPSCRSSARSASSVRSQTRNPSQTSRRSMAGASEMRWLRTQSASSRSSGSMQDARSLSSKPISNRGRAWRRRGCRSAS